jgi:hypothetical protein
MLEALTLRKGKYCSAMKLECSLPSRHSIQSSDPEDHRMKRHASTIIFYRVKWTYHGNEKLHGKPGRSSSYQKSQCSILFYHVESFSIVFLRSPRFVNLRMRFLLGMGATTPCVTNSLIIFIKVLIKNQNHSLTKF